MRDRFPGHYRPTANEFEALWDSALIVPDTNVLLNLYRLNEGARKKLLEILGALQERLFVPYQVAVEYQRNRIDVIEQQTDTYKEVEEAVSSFAASVGKGLRQHPRLDRKDLEERIGKAVAPVLEHLKELREDHPDPLTSEDPIGADVVRDALEPLLSGRIGQPRDLDGLVAKGKERYERKQPPGWKDEAKPEPDRYGDLAIWLDMVAKAEATELPVIFVTEERKPDWWEVRHNKALGPQPALVEEMREKAGQGFWLYGIERFMEVAAESLKIEFSEDEREDVARVETAASASTPRDVQWHGGGAVVHPLLLGDHAFPQTRHGLTNRTFDVGARRFKMYGGTVIPAGLSNRGQPGFPVAPGTGWIASDELSQTGVLLRLVFEPQMVGSHWAESSLICLVICPDGNRSIASQKTNTASATFNFPEDFGLDIPAQAGEYNYSWHYAPGGLGQQSTEVAAGEFTLPGDPEVTGAST